MTIYVDEAILPFRGQLYCHMATDGDIEELHKMAAMIGMKREWFQDKPGHPHYDLSPSKRTIAIRLGAHPIGSKEMIRICFKKKAMGEKLKIFNIDGTITEVEPLKQWDPRSNEEIQAAEIADLRAIIRALSEVYLSALAWTEHHRNKELQALTNACENARAGRSGLTEEQLQKFLEVIK